MCNGRLANHHLSRGPVSVSVSVSVLAEKLLFWSGGGKRAHHSQKVEKYRRAAVDKPTHPFAHGSSSKAANYIIHMREQLAASPSLPDATPCNVQER